MAKRKETGSLFPRKKVDLPDGYYSGDKPNPNLRAFVEAHLRESPYDPKADDYDVGAFNVPIETTKATAIYNMHVYWSKKPHTAIRQYIRHYTQPGDLVLDPFCGSGGTALSALLEGRKAIAIDRSPAATFITKNHCTPVDSEELQAGFEQVKKAIKDEIDWLYETRCDRCGGKAITGYTVYSQVFECPRCLTKIALYDCGLEESETAAGKAKTVNVCPICQRNGFTETIRAQSEKYGFVPVKVVYRCESGCKPTRAVREHQDAALEKRAYFEQFDLGKIEEIEEQAVPHWYPPHRMMNVGSDSEPWGDKWRAGTGNFRTVAELFTKRNLWALSVTREAIGKLENNPVRDALMFGLTGIMLNTTKMCQDRGKLGFNKGTYYIPQVFRELYVPNSLDYKIDNHLIPACEEIAELDTSDVCISTQSAGDLSAIGTNSVDYIFTDPPYADKIQYGELNFIWEAWLDFDTAWHNEEIIVNEIRGKSVADWESRMKKAMAECFRVLKPGRWLSLCYHDTSEGTWELIQDIMAEVGFIVDRSESALFIDAKQKSYNQRTADKVTQRDLVINFRKPKRGDWVKSRVVIPADADVPTFRELARLSIREYLQANPGETKDRIYDDLVSRMVRAGQMQAHNFQEILREVAEEVQEPRRKNLFENEDPDLFGSHVVSRWYLKETANAEVDEGESVKEDAAARTLGKFIKQRLASDRTQEGVHYSELWEQYVYTIKDRPRRPLIDWLSDYFFKTLSGTWRLPATPDEEELKARGRQAGTNRRIRRFLALLDAGDDIPDRLRPSPSDLAEWIRHSQRATMFEEGRRLYLYGQGDWISQLSDEAAAGVEEDYQICMRALQRAAAPAKRRSRKPGRKAQDQIEE
jgi:DNA modification methylase